MMTEKLLYLIIIFIFFSIDLRSQENSHFKKDILERTVKITTPCQYTGGGVVITSDNNFLYFATAAHVIRCPEPTQNLFNYKCEFSDGTEISFHSIVFQDSVTDLAIIQARKGTINYPSIACDSLVSLSTRLNVLSPLADWKIEPDSSIFSSYISINKARTKAEVYIPGIRLGYSGSPVFTEIGLAGVVLSQNEEYQYISPVRYIMQKLIEGMGGK
jgi:hypothetical protein